MDTAIHYSSLYETSPGEFAFDAHAAGDLAQWQAGFRKRLREITGLTAMVQDLAGHVPRSEFLEKEQLNGYSREHWQLWSEPNLALPFYLLRPDGQTGPLPLVIIPHGHNPPHLYVGLYNNAAEKEHIASGDRDIAVQAVHEGYIALAPTTRGFGDTRSETDIEEGKLSSCRIQLMHGLLVGRTPIGERVWDMSRLLDWALEELDVDTDRIALTGNSGGGTVAVFAAACDTRFTLTMPGSYFSTFAGSIGSIHHCDCNYVPGILRLGEMYDVAGLIAPRPFCAINGVEDAIFPISQTRYAYKHLRKIYDIAGAGDCCRLYEGNGGHRYYRDGAWPFVREFFGSIN